MNNNKIIIIGAGPAGICAAKTLVEAGLFPMVIDEGGRCGGQIYRQSYEGDQRDKFDLYGDQAPKAARLHQSFAKLIPNIDYRPETSVWHLSDKEIFINNTTMRETLSFDKLILATGATDRILPFKGWTMPGVYTLGAAQTALKSQAMLISDDIVFMGSSPLLYLVAYQYMKAGAKVKAIIDTAPLKAKINLLTAAVRDFATIRRGLYYGARLKAAGVRIINGVNKFEVLGNNSVEAVCFEKGNKKQIIKCQALAYNFGLRSETQLADLAGLKFAFNHEDRAWEPQSHIDTRTSNEDIYLAGDGASIEGADGAELSGELAALAVLNDLGLNFNQSRQEDLIKKRQLLRRARQSFNKAFPFPEDWISQLPDDLLLCRCEEITIGDMRMRQQFYHQLELNRTKAVSRVGMGRCQGRMCGAALAEVLRQDHACPIEDVGRLRAQPPIKPLFIKNAGSTK